MCVEVVQSMRVSAHAVAGQQQLQPWQSPPAEQLQRELQTVVSQLSSSAADVSLLSERLADAEALLADKDGTPSPSRPRAAVAEEGEVWALRDELRRARLAEGALRLHLSHAA
eukprot:Hpha_TRINITY_DN27993_c0_g1::TRINITY_DN27993_c0_g1_i2::g.44996::m.44996